MPFFRHHPAGSESQVVVPALTQPELSKLKANIELGSQLKEHLKSHVQRRKELEDQKNQVIARYCIGCNQRRGGPKLIQLSFFYSGETIFGQVGAINPGRG